MHHNAPSPPALEIGRNRLGGLTCKFVVFLEEAIDVVQHDLQVDAHRNEGTEWIARRMVVVRDQGGSGNAREKYLRK